MNYTFTDHNGDTWFPLPDSAPWSSAEDAYLMDGAPVYTMVAPEDAPTYWLFLAE